MGTFLTDMPGRQAAAYGSREAFDYYDNDGNRAGAWSFSQFADDVATVSRALVSYGLAGSSTVAMLTANAPQMLWVDFGAYRIGAVPVSIYSTATADQIKYILNDCKAQIIVTGDRRQYDLVCSLAPLCPQLRLIVACHAGAKGNGVIRAAGVATITWSEFMQAGQTAKDDLEARVLDYNSRVTPESLATLIYTSGTTGEPKGAMLTHANFDAAIRIHHIRLTTLTDKDSSLSFLPMTHIFEKAWSYLCLDFGMHVSINDNPHIVDKVMRKVRPTCMSSVPRFWEKVYAVINDKMGKMPLFKRTLAKRAIRVGAKVNLHYLRQGLPVPALLRMQYAFFDKQVLGPVRRAIGIDNGNIFPTAGAPVSDAVVELMHCLGINILVGYGLSETTATVTCFPTKDYVIGTVGTILPELEMRIGEDNEVQVKGPTIMYGYLNKPEETANAFTADGWFRTGDAGSIDAQGNLILTDRIKDLFKTSNGKYIAPQMLETRLGNDPYIDQVAIIGDKRKYVSALIIPAYHALQEYARRKQIEFKNNADLIRNADIKAFIQSRIDRVQKGLANFEQIKKFTLLPREFTIESGELTNTLKLRRPVINLHYAPQIEAMYS